MSDPTGGGRPSGAGRARLGRRALNRAALARQLLLRRAELPAIEAVGRLVALQAQEPNSPYLGLWSRLAGFRHEALTELLYQRRVVRSSLLRATQHLTTADDYLWLRPLVQPAFDRGRQAAFGRRTAGMDLAQLADRGRELLAGRVLTRPELGRLLAPGWPDRDPAVLAWSVQYLLPLVHPPPNGTWARGGATPFTLAEDWLDRPLAAAPPVEELVRRYLSAFGPGSVNDLQAWSGLTRLREVVHRLRPSLRSLRDEAGNELFDLPGAPLPDPDLPAPPRFLPEFDNLIVAHADRTRIMTDQTRKRICVGSMVHATVLVGGVVRGTWRLRREGDAAILTVELFEPVPKADRAALAEEGARLLGFAAAGAETAEVRLAPAG